MRRLWMWVAVLLAFYIVAALVLSVWRVLLGLALVVGLVYLAGVIRGHRRTHW